MVPFAQAFGWTPRQVTELTIPLMLRISTEVNRNAADLARGAVAPSPAGPASIDLTKMTADQAAGQLRKYGFG